MTRSPCVLIFARLGCDGRRPDADRCTRHRRTRDRRIRDLDVRGASMFAVGAGFKVLRGNGWAWIQER